MRSPAPPSDARLMVRVRALAILRSEVLADFEIELIAAAWARRALLADAWRLTAAERQVVEDALAAMISAPHQEMAA